MTTALLNGVLLDETQRAAAGTAGACIVLGAPGTGKTSTVVEWAAGRLGAPTRAAQGVVVLVPSRRGAARVRELLSGRVAATLRDPAVRTPHSLAWAVLRESAARDGQAPPRLVTGAESDVALADLLAGHEAGQATAPSWPDTVPAELRAGRAFRSDLRELWARLVERGLGPADLRSLGRDHGYPEWVAAAAVLEERLRVTGLRGDNAWDPAEIVDEAAARLVADDGLRTWAHSRIGALAVDDAHDLTSAGWRLVWALGAPGRDLLICGDPDLATQTFRGARPTVFADLPALAGVAGAPAPIVVLPTVWRSGEVLCRVHRDVGARIGVVTAAHRRPAAADPGGRARVLVCRDAVDEAATVAAALRAWHHDPESPMPWSSMGVIVRSIRRADALQRALARSGVPFHVPGPGRPLRDEPAVRTLLRAATVAADPDLLDGPIVRELACGLLGGTDTLRWRRLIRAVRAVDSGARPVADPATVLAVAVRAAVVGVDAVATDLPSPWDGLPATHIRPLVRLARILAAGRAQVHAGPEALLWAIWSASGLDRRWRSVAMVGGGPEAATADADLDAVIALFDVVERFAENRRGVGIVDVAAHVASLGVADDRLSDGVVGDTVTITTPAGAAGLEWDGVVVSGVQDGVWPDLRVRGSLLRTADLVDVLDGRAGAGAADQTRQTLDDETRLFLVAVSRARRELLVTAVAGEDERPSHLCQHVAGPGATLDVAGSGAPPTWHDHTLESVVVALRRFAGGGAPVDSSGVQMPTDQALDPDAAARLLARLAAAGVPGAHPDEWWWTRSAVPPPPESLADPASPDVSQWRVSPSSVGAFATCPLRWYLGRIAGDNGDDTARRLGELIHAAAQHHPRGGLAELNAFVDARWAELGVAEGWMDARLRRRAREMVRRLADWLAGRADPFATEVGFDTVLAGVRVVGTIDRIETSTDGSAHLIDFKTGAAKTKAQAAEDPQLAIYQMAVDSGGVAGAARSSGAVLVHVGGTARAAAEREQRPPTDDDRARVEALLQRLDDGVATGIFEATPGAHCERCPVRTSCPADPTGGYAISGDAVQVAQVGVTL